mmetsp:Transcript_4442/g.5120  ORF Transcript_4442/g.5120 Transcript_4442/m.5120 type:complete len:221 (-) Transcript_4442:23-685(-)
MTKTGIQTNEEKVVHHTKPQNPKSWPQLPQWAETSSRLDWGERLNILEWDGDSSSNDMDDNSEAVSKYRLSNGWKGSDLVHSETSPIRILEYRVQYYFSNVNIMNRATLTGIAHFTKQAESHQGYCHGGSMCSVMDDIIGWTAFCASGKCIPWSGFTVQVNTKLSNPIMVDSVLMITCSIEKIERRKVWLRAVLTDPVCDKIHAEGEGLAILNKGVLEGA